MVIAHFERLAIASTKNYGGPTAGVIVVREDADTITGEEQDEEADRVIRLLVEERAMAADASKDNG
jgi:hypothetical protein